MMYKLCMNYVIMRMITKNLPDFRPRDWAPKYKTSFPTVDTVAKWSICGVSVVKKDDGPLEKKGIVFVGRKIRGKVTTLDFLGGKVCMFVFDKRGWKRKIILFHKDVHRWHFRISKFGSFLNLLAILCQQLPEIWWDQ